MPQFAYEAINDQGDVVNGKLEADHEAVAITQLQNSGFMVVDVKEVSTSTLLSLFQRRRKVKLGDLALFSRQLSAMLNAGIPLTRALFVLSQQSDNPTLREAVEEIARSVEGGIGLSEALKNHPDIFSHLYIGMIRAGELGGTLEETLYRLSDQLDKEKNLSDNVKSATFYPAAVAVFAVLVLLGMLFFLVPIFEGFFPPEATIPLPTQVIIFLSDSLRAYWYLWFFVLVGAVLAGRYFIKSPSGVQAWDKIKFRIPIFGSLIHRVVIARFSRTLSTLLTGGIPMVQALETAGPTSGSFLVEQAVQRASERIQEGRSLVKPLEESGLFPPLVTHMVSIGEETGELPGLLTRIAEFYEDEVATMTKGLTALIEPLMLIIVGALVGGMLIALYLPIFTVITEIA